MTATAPVPAQALSVRIATEIAAKPSQVAAAIALLDEGATVPFIARYRKEATGGLDDVQLRALEERLTYLRELEARRQAILDSIRERLLTLPAGTRVLPGHGDETVIGVEAADYDAWVARGH